MSPFAPSIAASWLSSFAAPRPLTLDPFGRTDPGMRVRDDLMRAGLPIDAEGKAIVENDE